INGTTGAKKLSLPFAQGTATPIEIIRRPPMPYPSDDSEIGPSRLYSQSQIRVMLAYTPAENHPHGTAQDADDVRLANVRPFDTAWDVSGVAGKSFFAMASQDCTAQANIGCEGPKNGSTDPGKNNWNSSDFVPPAAFRPTSSPNIATGPWPLIDGW